MRLNIGENAMKFELISIFVGVEFDQSALQHLNQVGYYRIVGLLLLASGKPRIDRHLFYLILSAIKFN